MSPGGNRLFPPTRRFAKSLNSKAGRVAEWFKAPVLKTGVPARVPWVRIPPLPPSCALSSLETSVTERTQDMGGNLVPKGMGGGAVSVLREGVLTLAAQTPGFSPATFAVFCRLRQGFSGTWVFR